MSALEIGVVPPNQVIWFISSAIILALALGLDLPLITDDYRLQNTMQNVGKQISSVDTKGAKQVWKWELRCTGSGSRTEVPTNVDRSIKGPVMDCDSCGSPMMLKRVK